MIKTLYENGLCHTMLMKGKDSQPVKQHNLVLNIQGVKSQPTFLIHLYKNYLYILYYGMLEIMKSL